MGLVKVSKLKDIIRNIPIYCKSIENNGMKRKVYDSLFSEKYGNTYTMVLFSLTSYATVSLMLKRLMKVRSADMLLPYALLKEKEDKGIHSDFLLPTEAET